MNKKRRAEIVAVISKLESTKEIIDEAFSEHRAWENLPESLKCADRGAAMEDNAENLSSALEAIEEAIDYLEEVVSND